MAQLMLAWDVMYTRRSMHLKDILRDILPVTDAFKVGSVLMTVNGGFSSTSQADETRVLAYRQHKPVLWDFKINETPNTTRHAIRNLTKKGGVAWCTIHASSGKESLKAALDASKGTKLVPLALTVLTHLDNKECLTIFGNTIEEKVLRFAEMYVKLGGKGIVCSGQELAILKKYKLIGPDALTTVMTPGIRLEGAPPDDQTRTTAPYEAVLNGATHLIVGRPIYEASDQLQAARDFRAAIRRAEIRLLST